MPKFHNENEYVVAKEYETVRIALDFITQLQTVIFEIWGRTSVFLKPPQNGFSACVSESYHPYHSG